jgi:hypothetical protein
MVDDIADICRIDCQCDMWRNLFGPSNIDDKLAVVSVFLLGSQFGTALTYIAFRLSIYSSHLLVSIGSRDYFSTFSFNLR